MTASAEQDLAAESRDLERRDNIFLGMCCILGFVLGGLFLAALAGWGLVVFGRANRSITFVAWMSFFYGLIGWVILALAVLGVI